MILGGFYGYFANLQPNLDTATWSKLLRAPVMVEIPDYAVGDLYDVVDILVIGAKTDDPGIVLKVREVNRMSDYEVPTVEVEPEPEPESEPETDAEAARKSEMDESGNEAA